MTTDPVKIINLWGERYVKAGEYAQLLILLERAVERIPRKAVDEDLLDDIAAAFARTRFAEQP